MDDRGTGIGATDLLASWYLEGVLLFHVQSGNPGFHMLCIKFLPERTRSHEGGR